jgi:DME family drug/metabolite transporter
MQQIQQPQPAATLRRDGIWFVTGGAILWGTIGVATQAIYRNDNTTSLFINLARMLIASPLLFLACWRILGQKMFHIRRRDLGIMVLTGISMAISQAAYFASIYYAGVTIATLLTVSVAPVIVSAASVVLKIETPTRRIVVALGCAILGSVLLVGRDSAQGTQSNLTLGVAYALLSAVTYAGVLMCGRFLAGGYHPLQVTTITFTVGTLVLALCNLISPIVIVHTVSGWLLILYLAVAPTAVAYWLFQKGLRSISATSASVISMLDPVVAAFLAWLLFGERLPVIGLIGAGLLLLSIFLLATEAPE